ncbi:hypothetical protein [Piscinibacter gummiphilus]|uniref:Uncharacterized protein n=1 Tax=Piscinibacter gummiphilus TaxID=946333 RepID=A0ABZ0D1L2_9BURK|nr:hypothetical protein [Piscinibacter gummiphilus]WOB11140.1 hypothetical protein RXV79_27265 [Piscinibacter gummiphilus]
MSGAELRPLSKLHGAASADTGNTGLADAASTSPKPKRVRPGWKPTILRQTTFNELRKVQKSTVDPRLDLSYLTDACVRLALEMGREQIVSRALDDLRPVQKSV